MTRIAIAFLLLIASVTAAQAQHEEHNHMPAPPSDGVYSPHPKLPGPPQIGDFGNGHADWHWWYSTAEPKGDGTPGPLMRPLSPSTPCCGEDCRPTVAKYDLEKRVWLFYLDRLWIAVPENRIKHGVVAPNQGAHACASRRNNTYEPEVYCAILPGGSS